VFCVMEWLIVVHVLAAVIGLGPAFAFPMLLKKTGSKQEMERNLRQVAQLETFPKIGGLVAVVSGLCIFFFGSYGSFMQIWVLGSLIMYILIEILIVGFLVPTVKRLHGAIAAAVSEGENGPLLGETTIMYGRVRNYHLWASILSVVIFVLMVVRPH